MTSGAAAMTSGASGHEGRRFDARAWWGGLTAEQRQQVGEMAALYWLSAELGMPTVRWQHAFEEAEQALTALMPDPDPDRYPDGPDLAALGIRTCRVCGCTDQSACEGSCCWLAEDLCSCCVALAQLGQ